MDGQASPPSGYGSHLQSFLLCPFVPKSQTNSAFRYPLKEKCSRHSRNPYRVINFLILASKDFFKSLLNTGTASFVKEQIFKTEKSERPYTR